MKPKHIAHSFLLYLFLFALGAVVSCQQERSPETLIEGTWGLAGMQLDESRAGKSLNPEEQEAMRDQFQAIFNWFDMERYTVLLINNKEIEKRRRYNNSSNNDYNNDKIYVTEYQSGYRLMHRNDSLFLIHLDRYHDSLQRTVYQLTPDTLIIESEHSTLGRHIYTRIP